MDRQRSALLPRPAASETVDDQQITLVEERLALRRIPILREAPDDELDKLTGAVDQCHLAAGEWLFHYGDPSCAIYVVESGRLSMVDPTGGFTRDLGPGDVVGELGVILQCARSAGVRALRDSTVWRIESKAFKEVLDTAPRLQAAMMHGMARILNDSSTVGAQRRPRIIGIVGAACTADSAATRVAMAIDEKLRAFGRSFAIMPDSAELAEIVDPQVLSGRFGQQLDWAERANDWVMLVADHASGPLWHDFVVAQSDRLILLGDERPASRLVHAHDRPRPVHLVVSPEMHPSWWDIARPTSQHPLTPDGLAALARRIAGRSLGLVLAGGGARGLAHFGVFDELVRAGVTIDRFGGTSMGAICAAAFALDMGPDHAIDIARKFVSQGNPFGDYAVPAVAMSRGGRIGRLIDQFGADVSIEHLPKEFFAVSTDLVTGRQVVHRRGSLSRAVKASAAIPGLVPPVKHDGQILVDGGMVNNLPTDVMCADEDGEVIGVDLRQDYQPNYGLALLPAAIQPPRMIRQLITGSRDAVPALQETMMRTIDIVASGGGVNHAALPRLAATIRPRLGSVGMLDFKKLDAAVQAGRAAAREALESDSSLRRAVERC